MTKSDLPDYKLAERDKRSHWEFIQTDVKFLRKVMQQLGFLSIKLSCVSKEKSLHILLWTVLQYALQTKGKSIPLHSAAVPAIYWRETSAKDSDEKVNLHYKERKCFFTLLSVGGEAFWWKFFEKFQTRYE